MFLSLFFFFFVLHFVIFFWGIVLSGSFIKEDDFLMSIYIINVYNIAFDNCYILAFDKF